VKLGIRPQDKRIFAEAAKKFQVWLVLRQSNPASLNYIGKFGYFPKPITCKAKTADDDAITGRGAKRHTYDTAGLVVDPTIHKNVFSADKRDEAYGLWNDFKAKYLDAKGSDYAVDRDAKSQHYGCVLYKGKYLHSDYDLYDIIAVGHENANLTVVGERDGAPDFRPAHLYPVEDYVNARIGAEMVHHGGQYQFTPHTKHFVEVFGPKGEFTIERAAPWYAKNFPNRRTPGPPGGFVKMLKKA
jgi:hypothetical protein